MPQLLFLALVGFAAYYGYRRLQRDAERVISRARRNEKEARTGAQGTLEKDPVTGVYRLRKSDD